VNGGDALVQALIAGGVDLAFTVPGESFLTVLEALRRHRTDIRLIATRHEAGATFAAESFGRLARRLAAVFVSRGPGATNAAIGVHTAMQGSNPLVLFVGHVRRRSKGREAFQEIDLERMFAPVAKAVLEPDAPEEIGPITSRAIALATEGRPGPVVVVLPRDLTEAPCDPASGVMQAAHTPRLPDERQIVQAAELVGASRHPIVIAGEMVSFADANTELLQFAEASGAAVMAAYRQQDVFPNTHPAYAGHLEINRARFQREAFAQADAIIAAGSRLDGITTEDYTLLGPRQRLLHIYPDETTAQRSGAEVAICADVGAALAAIARELPAPPAARRSWRDNLHRAYLDFSTPGNVTVHGAVDLSAVVTVLAGAIPEETVILADGGSFARWVHRYLRFTRPHTYAGPVSGAMGYAIPGALGAVLACGPRPVIAFVGDGSFMMTGQELATAVEQNLPIKLIVCDNRAQGSILLAQWQQFGADADYGTRLLNPDFVGLARAYNVPAWRVTRTDEFAAAFDQAMSADGPALLHLLTDQRDIAPFGAGKDAV
jgi:acetolactate synthase-1/2/3 large subunit